MHIAPGHGLEDYQVGLEHGLDIYSPLDDEGKYVDDGQIPAELVGISVLENSEGKSAANEKVLEIITNNGSLLKSAKISHQYPHCWRSKTPVISLRSTRTTSAKRRWTRYRKLNGSPKGAKTA